ncbi:unnamed protein product [Polarella glacialis]|uniref:C3H1-type domain-containing protein n=1 Tax=Polarella glacialis TaxID=89957 RepID=A0A813EJ48_POLGL|nr:unnamed protein product [Polarella glacialis]
MAEIGEFLSDGKLLAESKNFMTKHHQQLKEAMGNSPTFDPSSSLSVGRQQSKSSCDPSSSQSVGSAANWLNSSACSSGSNSVESECSGSQGSLEDQLRKFIKTKNRQLTASKKQAGSKPRHDPVSAPSRGSKNHWRGQCRACIFVLSAAGCGDGAACNFCHYAHLPVPQLHAEEDATNPSSHSYDGPQHGPSPCLDDRSAQSSSYGQEDYNRPIEQERSQQALPTEPQGPPRTTISTTANGGTQWSVYRLSL